MKKKDQELLVNALQKIAQYQGGTWAHNCQMTCSCPRNIAVRALTEAGIKPVSGVGGE